MAISASSAAAALTKILTSVRSSWAGAREASLPSRSLICRSTSRILTCVSRIAFCASAKRWPMMPKICVQSGCGAAAPLAGAGRLGSCARLPISVFCASAACTAACKTALSSFSFSMASSTRFLSVAATASSVRGTNIRRLSTEPISSLAVALPSTRIELAMARAGRSANRMTWSPASSRTLPSRVSSAPDGKTMTASMREVPLMSAA